MENVGQVLLTALDMEQQGYKYYSEAVDRVSDPIVKTILTSLANDELEHSSIINRFYDALSGGMNWPDVDASTPVSDDASKQISNIFEQTIDLIEADASYISVYEAAREMELKSIEYYQSGEIEATEKRVAEFFKFLVNVEQAHLKALDTLLQFTRASIKKG
ncbi:MAG: ferritin family protein [Armatimonadota bacterium]